MRKIIFVKVVIPEIVAYYGQDPGIKNMEPAYTDFWWIPDLKRYCSSGKAWSTYDVSCLLPWVHFLISFIRKRPKSFRCMIERSCCVK